MPQKKLAYTWNVFMPGQIVSNYPESYLTVELDDTNLTLTHLPVLEAFVKLNAVGWHTFLDMVDAAAGGGPVEVGSSRVDLQACKLEYSIVSPK